MYCRVRDARFIEIGFLKGLFEYLHSFDVDFCSNLSHLSLYLKLFLALIKEQSVLRTVSGISSEKLLDFQFSDSSLLVLEFWRIMTPSPLFSVN